MTLNELKDYLRIVVDMESACYFQRQLKNELTRKLNMLTPPKKKSVKEPVDHTKTIFSILWGTVGFAVLGFFLLLLCVVFIKGITAGAISESEPMWDVALFVVPIVGGIWGGFRGFLERRNSQKTYQKELQQYHSAVTINEKKYQVESIAYIFQTTLYKYELAELEKQIQRSEQHLQTLYDVNVIHPKYREFTRVCSLYEYIDTGRCWSLEKTSRDEGAYNILEREILAKTIILQLERIISRLDEIRDNQYELYVALQRTNQRITVIIAENNQLINQWSTSGAYRGTAEHQVEALLKGSKLSEYINERAKIELSYLKRLQSY